MSAVVLAGVLLAAVMHGGWNAIAKAVPDPLVSSMLIGGTYLVAGAVGCLLLPPLSPEAWWFVIASSATQVGYMLLLTTAYARTEFSTAYPLARGVSVLGITVVSTLWLGEHLTRWQLAGVGVVVLALLTLAMGGSAVRQRGPVALTLAVGLVTTVYSTIDGIGVRVSGDPLTYGSWIFFLQGLLLPLLCLRLARDRRVVLQRARRHAVLGIVGGAVSLAAYLIVLWAQSQAPLAVVSALRETSVLAAGAIGYLVFGEPFRSRRLVATLVAVAGTVAVRLGA